MARRAEEATPVCNSRFETTFSSAIQVRPGQFNMLLPENRTIVRVAHALATEARRTLLSVAIEQGLRDDVVAATELSLTTPYMDMLASQSLSCAGAMLQSSLGVQHLMSSLPTDVSVGLLRFLELDGDRFSGSPHGSDDERDTLSKLQYVDELMAAIDRVALYTDEHGVQNYYSWISEQMQELRQIYRWIVEKDDPYSHTCFSRFLEQQVVEVQASLGLSASGYSPALLQTLEDAENEVEQLRAATLARKAASSITASGVPRVKRPKQPKTTHPKAKRVDAIYGSKPPPPPKFRPLTQRQKKKKTNRRHTMRGRGGRPSGNTRRKARGVNQLRSGAGTTQVAAPTDVRVADPPVIAVGEDELLTLRQNHRILIGRIQELQKHLRCVQEAVEVQGSGPDTTDEPIESAQGDDLVQSGSRPYDNVLIPTVAVPLGQRTTSSKTEMRGTLGTDAFPVHVVADSSRVSGPQGHGDVSVSSPSHETGAPHTMSIPERMAKDPEIAKAVDDADMSAIDSGNFTSWSNEEAPSGHPLPQPSSAVAPMALPEAAAAPATVVTVHSHSASSDDGLSLSSNGSSEPVYSTSDGAKPATRADPTAGDDASVLLTTVAFGGTTSTGSQDHDGVLSAEATMTRTQEANSHQASDDDNFSLSDADSRNDPGVVIANLAVQDEVDDEEDDW